MNKYFGSRRTNRPHETPNYGPGKCKLDIYYHRNTYCYPEKLAHIQRKLEISGQ